MKQSKASKPIRMRGGTTSDSRCASPDEMAMAISLGDYSNRRQPRRRTQPVTTARTVSHAGYLFKRSNQPYREVTPAAQATELYHEHQEQGYLMPVVLEPDDVEHLSKSDLTTESALLRALCLENGDNPDFRAQWKVGMEGVFGIGLPPSQNRTGMDLERQSSIDYDDDDSLQNHWFPLRNQSPEPPIIGEDDASMIDYLDPNDGHLWRAMYCILTGDALYFYRSQANADAPEAAMERQQVASGDRNTIHHSAQHFENCISLESVGTVRSAEQEHGANTLELFGDEKLILRAHNRDEMNQWLFQFHLCIASFVMDIVDSARSPMEFSFLHYSPARPRVLAAASFSPQFQSVISQTLSHGHGRHTSGRRQRGQNEWLSHSARQQQPDDLLPFPLDGTHRVVTPLLPRQSDEADDNTFPLELCAPQSDTSKTKQPLPYVPPHLRTANIQYIPRAVRQQQTENVVDSTSTHALGDDAIDDNVDSFHEWLGGCADPRFVAGSVTDDQFIPRKASRLGKVRTEPCGYHDGRIDVGAVSECGIRESNEDSFFVTNDLLRTFGDDQKVSTEEAATSLFAIFDGHCGDQAARFAAEQFTRYMHQESLQIESRSLSEGLVEIMESAILSMDKAFCNFCVENGRDWDSGSTALMVSLFENTLNVANLGDARCIIGRTMFKSSEVATHEAEGWVELPQDDYTNGRYLWKEITDIHSPNRFDERERLARANGWVTTEKEIPVGQLKRMALDDDDVLDILQRCFAERYQPSPKASAPHRMLKIWRVCGELAVSRSLGDRDFKADYNLQTVDELGQHSWDPTHLFLCYPENHEHSFVGDLVSNQPEFTSISVGNSAEEFVVLACDGLWDVLDPDDAYRVTRDLLFERGWPAKKAAARLAELAVHLGSSDNITVIVGARQRADMFASRDSVARFVDDVGLLWASSNLQSFEHPPDSFQFLRDCVAPSKPCIVRNGLGNTTRIDLDDLVERYSDTEVVVAVTPDGYGDCVRSTTEGPMFVEPQERTIQLGHFRTQLREQNKNKPDIGFSEHIFPTSSTCETERLEPSEDSRTGIFYYSRQNDCLRRELPELWEELGLPRTIQWAEEAFATGSPDAVNIWIGNENSVSSMHKDHYENLFFVLSGEKIFTLCPPADSPFLYERPFSHANFHQASSGSWSVQPRREAEEKVHWIQADIERRGDPAYLKRFPLLRYVHPSVVRVQAGECLYIPALWHHRVTQSCETVGINYWYDMRFDSPSWCYFRLCQSLTQDDEEKVLE